MLSFKQVGINNHFWFFCMTWPGIEPRSPGPLANTLTIMSKSGVVATEKGDFGLPSTTVANFTNPLLSIAI